MALLFVAGPMLELTLPGAGHCPRPGLQVGASVSVSVQVDVARGGRSCCLCPLTACMGLKDGPGLAFQNSKPDSLLKMEEEQKLEKSPLSGNKDTKFSFSFSNKKLLGYVHVHARRGWCLLGCWLSPESGMGTLRR